MRCQHRPAAGGATASEPARRGSRSRPPRAARRARSRRSCPVSRPGAGAGVQALRVAPRALLDRRVDEHLDERQPRRLVQPPRGQPVLAERGDERDDRDRARVGEQPRDVRDAADVLRPRRGIEAEVAGEPVAEVVAVEQVGEAARPRPARARPRPRSSTCPTPAGRSARRSRRAGPSRPSASSAPARSGASGCPGGARARPRAPGRAASTIPAATVSCVRSSIRMNAPVARLAAYGSASTGAAVRSVTRPMSLSPSSSAGARLERVDVDPRGDRGDVRPHAARRVLEQVARADARRRLDHPADGRVELARDLGRVARRRRRGRRGRRRARPRARSVATIGGNARSTRPARRVDARDPRARAATGARRPRRRSPARRRRPGPRSRGSRRRARSTGRGSGRRRGCGRGRPRPSRAAPAAAGRRTRPAARDASTTLSPSQRRDRHRAHVGDPELRAELARTPPRSRGSAPRRSPTRSILFTHATRCRMPSSAARYACRRDCSSRPLRASTSTSARSAVDAPVTMLRV